ncbi:MAG: hypothetical protein KGL11_03250 [Alphaproteobacteria bacterium]|nr:hypothetical protein [Alphaproteobacteria bacterium]
MRSSSGIGFGTSFLLFLLAAVSGAAVSLFLIISLDPLVALFPPTSGAQEIAYGIAIMWGAVVAATVGVLAIGSFRRRRQTGDFYDPRWQERYVPTAPRHAPAMTAAGRDHGGDRAYCPAPVAPRDNGRAALDSRLRQMDVLMAANRALVERLEHATAPQPVSGFAVAPLRPAVAPRPQPRPMAVPARRLHASSR